MTVLLDPDYSWSVQKDREPCEYGGQTVRMRGKLVKLYPHWSISTLNPYVQAFRDTVKEGGTMMVQITDIDVCLGDVLRPFAHILSNHKIE